MRLAERVWYGSGPGAVAARVALAPFAYAYAAATSVRNALYDAGVLSTRVPIIPAISIGNLTVGGTGKTPIAAWFAGRLATIAKPAIVLRGYGSDEVDVHRRLNPGVPIVVDADRVNGIRAAEAHGADVAILDDAFQHRRVRRAADVVVVSAEQMARDRRLLPAGPWREELRSVRRADLLIITRKSAARNTAEAYSAELARIAQGIPRVQLAIAPAALVAAGDSERMPLEALRGRRILALAAIGEPSAFAAQLSMLGAQVTLAAFPDHHPFSAEDITLLAERAVTHDLTVCTLKDAVKLAVRWPGPRPLWYVSQDIVLEHGAEQIDRLIERVLAARKPIANPAG